MKVKCFALWQPWATLVIEGLKTFETRSQYSSHRGLTGILATKKAPDWAEALFYQEPFYSRLKEKGYNNFKDLPTGGIVGTVNVTNWLKMIRADLKPIHPKVEIPIIQNSIEKEFGHWEIGRYAIELSHPDKFLQPFSARGQQNLLFDIEIPEEYILISPSE